jgi:hypothetical protein
MNGELSLLLVPGPAHELGLVASAVREIVPAHAWQGDPPVDLLEATIGKPAGAGDARVLVVARAEGEPLVVRVVGRLRMQNLPQTAAMPLPPLLAPHARWVSGVVIPDDAPPIVVVDCEHLGRR